MPLYSYRCPNCHTIDKRIAGVDDHTAICIKCEGVMLRKDMDIWGPLWSESQGVLWDEVKQALAKVKTQDSPYPDCPGNEARKYLAKKMESKP